MPDIQASQPDSGEADQELLELRQAFAVECGELLADMESSLLLLEGDPDAQDGFARLFRTVHTIKGSASIVQFEPVERFCHQIEHLLVRIREGELALNHELVVLLLKCHDHIRDLAGNGFRQSAAGGAINLPAAQASLEGAIRNWEGKAALKPSAAPAQGDESEPSSAEEAAAPSAISAKAQRALRVDAVKIDQLSDLVIDLMSSFSTVEAHLLRIGDHTATEAANHVSELIKQIQEKTTSLRMVAVNTIFQRFERIVHDAGIAAGKHIRLAVTGGDTELDKAVAEKLYEPLLHLVRNAIDHGIETGAERTGGGKPEVGTIRLDALREAGDIVIRVGDDGRGIDRKAVAKKALSMGLLSHDSPAGKDVINCIFEPGFSTKDRATMLSGRGVGMDSVKQFVESIRGRISVETASGVGTEFRINIPLSLLFVDGFMVSLGETLYLVSMDLVKETIELPDRSKAGTLTNGCLKLREKLLPCLDLREILAVDDPLPEIRHVLVIKHESKEVGLIVDRLHGAIKTPIKPLGLLYRDVDFISGAGILGDGSIVLLLETGKLLELGGAA